MNELFCHKYKGTSTRYVISIIVTYFHVFIYINTISSDRTEINGKNTLISSLCFRRKKCPISNIVNCTTRRKDFIHNAKI